MTDMLSQTHIDAADIRRRLAAYGASGNVDDLWPDVPRALRRAGHRRVFDVTQSVLNDSPNHRHLASTDEHQLRALGVAAYASGMGPLLGYWIETKVITADISVAELLAQHLTHGRRRSAEIGDAALTVVGSFLDRGVTPTILKGLFTSQRFFPEPGVRPLADVDLLVSPSSRAAAEDALQSQGYLRTASSYGQSSWRLKRHEGMIHSLTIDHALNPWTIDLHTSIDRRFTGGFWARMGKLPFEAVRPWKLGENPVRVFAQPLQLVHLTVHTATTIHQLQLLRLVELAIVIREEVRVGALEWEGVLALVDELGVARFVHPTLEFAERLVPGLLPQGFRAKGQSQSTPRMRRFIRQRVASGLTVGGRRSVDEILLWARGPGEVIRAAAHVFFSRGKSGWLSLYSRRLRLLLKGRFSWRAG